MQDSIRQEQCQFWESIAYKGWPWDGLRMYRSAQDMQNKDALQKAHHHDEVTPEVMVEDEHEMEDGSEMKDADMISKKGVHKMKDGKWMKDEDMTETDGWHQMPDGHWMLDEEMVQD